MFRLKDHLPDIRKLMLTYGVEKAYAFGSAVKNTMNEASDVDFVFSFPAEMDFVKYSDNYFALAEAFEKLLGRRVDLVAEKTIKNPYLVESINQNKILIIG